MKLLFTLYLLVASVVVSQEQEPFGKLNIPSKHQQVVLVTTNSWTSTIGSLQLYSRSDSSWISYGKKIQVVVGKNGLGWGRGLHPSIQTGSQKTEGDGKAPAGIFEFGEAFGYDSIPSFHIQLPYRRSTDRDYWIDDISSPDYNQWVSIPANKENNPKAFWRSYERMKRQDHLYELGLVVKHNMNPPVPSKGSAIFFHIWRTQSSPTLGCTAMSKEDLKTILSWLDPKKNPVLIQVPVTEVNKLNFSR